MQSLCMSPVPKSGVGGRSMQHFVPASEVVATAMPRTLAISKRLSGYLLFGLYSAILKFICELVCAVCVRVCSGFRF
jgi:hypothetical protein